MNSKLFSRVAAVVLSVAMLSTVSFAAGVDYDAAGKASNFTVTLDENFQNANEQMTIMAYTVGGDVTTATMPDFDPNNSTMKIVAVNQVATDAFGLSGTVSFDKNRIPADKNLAIVLSGSSATTAPHFKAVYVTDDIHLVTVTEGITKVVSDQYTKEENDGSLTVYKDVKLIDCSYTVPANHKLSKARISFADTFKDNEGNTLVIEEALNVEGGATATFQVCLTGLPAEYFGETPETPITANPSVDVEGNVQ